MKVEKGIATQEVNEWLEFKRVSEKKKEARAEEIESIISEVEEGNLSVDDKFNLNYSLKFPIEDSEGNEMDQILSFKARLRSNELDPYLKGVKGADVDGRLRAYICALTGKNSQIIKKLDTEDHSICASIALFFL